MRFRILGPVRVEEDGAEMAVAAGRDRVLLGVMLLYANQLVGSDRLIDAVWPGGPPGGARNQLQGCVSRLRKRLGSAVIATEPDGYRLVVDPRDLDLLEFRRLLAEARAAANERRYEDAVASYRTALGLWRGPALAGVDGHMVVRAAAALDEERMQALEERLAAELSAGAGGELVAELTDLIGQHPLREGLHKGLMLALYRAGRQADALMAYRDARQMLLNELGIEPGSELRELHLAILNGDPALDRSPAGPALPPPPLRPRQLPLDVAGFSGRAGAVKALYESLVRRSAGVGPMVISAIAGTAGVGKTALAVHWAHRVADRFPDGQIFIDLRGYAATSPMEPAEALAVLLRSLGTAGQDIPAEVDEAVRLYRTLLADRRVLLVLDNAASADQVRPLLPGGAACQAIVTSRDRLSGLVARDGARMLILDVLTPAEANELLTNMLGVERINAEWDEAAQLARACAYLPLAIRIAAANVLAHPDWTIARFAGELLSRDRLSMLKVEGDEHNAVGAAFDLSYQHLSSEAQRMFRMLALVPGPDFTADVAAALTQSARGDAERLLDRLVRASLLGRRPRGGYSFHDLLRVYARQRLQEESKPERQAASGRLMRWYVEATGAAVDIVYPESVRLPPSSDGRETVRMGFHDATAGFDWLEKERPNLVAAVLYAAEEKAESAWLLADRLRSYLLRSRYLADLRVITNAALKAAESAGDSVAQAAMQLGMATVHKVMGAYPLALEHYRAASRLAHDADWTDGQAAVLADMSEIHWVRGELYEASDRLAESLALSRQINEPAGEATALLNLGVVYQELGQLKQAIEYHAQALTLSRREGLRGFEGLTLHNLGDVSYELGKFHEADDYLTQALHIHRQVGNRPGVSGCLSVIARLRSDQGRLTDARAAADAALKEASGISDPHDEPVALNALGGILARLGHIEQAANCHQQALDAAREAGDRGQCVRALLGLAFVAQRRGRLTNATEQCSSALAMARDAHYLLLEGVALTLLAELYLAEGKRDESENSAELAIGAHRLTGHRLGEARTLYVLGKLRTVAGQAEAAADASREAATIFSDIGAQLPEDLLTR